MADKEFIILRDELLELQQETDGNTTIKIQDHIFAGKLILEKGKVATRNKTVTGVSMTQILMSES